MTHALALAAVLQAGPREHLYRIRLSAQTGASVSVTANVPAGWIAAICTTRTCALRHTTLTVPRAGVAVFDVHLYQRTASAESAGTATVIVSGDTLTLRF